jgi:hypothetical protein
LQDKAPKAVEAAAATMPARQCNYHMLPTIAAMFMSVSAVEAPTSTTAGQALQDTPTAGNNNSSSSAATAVPGAVEVPQQVEEKFNW